MTLSVPVSAEQITLSWLNTVLFSQGELAGAELLDFSISVVGDGVGFLGDLCRVVPAYKDSKDYPESLIIKFPTLFEAGKQTGKELGAYQRESEFYKNLGNELPWCRPPTYYFSAKTADDEYLLVMEDLGEHRFVAQADGLQADDAFDIVIALARLHAHYWSSPVLEEMTWLRPFSDYAEIYPPQIETGWPLYQQKFSYAVAPEFLELFPKANSLYPDMCRALQTRPATLLHGDARMENVAFSSKPGPEGVRFYDWQLNCYGPAAYDLMYFFMMSINVEDWTSIGEELITTYYQELCAFGVSGYSESELRQDLSLAACLMFGFTSMVGNLLPDDESAHTVVKATMPRYTNLFHEFNVRKTIEDFKP